MAKIGYIILAHQKPMQLIKLLKSIESEQNHLFLHIDKRVDLNLFYQYSEYNLLKNLTLVKRYKTHWGGFGLAKATLEGIRQAIGFKCEYIVLLSGSDYPIKSKEAINDFLEKNADKSFFSHYQMPAPHWLPNKEINRIKKYYFHIWGRLFEYPLDAGPTSLLRKIVNSVLGLFLVKERALPDNLVPYGGDQWFCITAKVGGAVLQFYNDRPDVYKFLKFTLIPDEIFLQTAIFNSKDVDIKNSIVNTCLTYLHWQNRNSPSPSILTLNEFEALKQSDKLFARKFDYDAHPELLRKINSELLGITE
jgi:Core-2/I-Branching enzyme